MTDYSDDISLERIGEVALDTIITIVAVEQATLIMNVVLI